MKLQIGARRVDTRVTQINDNGSCNNSIYPLSSAFSVFDNIFGIFCSRQHRHRRRHPRPRHEYQILTNNIKTTFSMSFRHPSGITVDVYGIAEPS